MEISHPPAQHVVNIKKDKEDDGKFFLLYSSGDGIQAVCKLGLCSTSELYL